MSIEVGTILVKGAFVAPKLFGWAKKKFQEWKDPYPKFWLDEGLKLHRRLLFGFHSANGFWMEPGRNRWFAVDSDTHKPLTDPESGEQITYAPDGIARPAFNYRGYHNIFQVGNEANALFNSDPDAGSRYSNRLYIGGENINTKSSAALLAVERAFGCGLTPMRFRINIVSHPPEIYAQLPKIKRAFIEENVRYEKEAVVDTHDFLLDTHGKIRAGAKIEDSAIQRDFLLLSVLPTPDRSGRIINVTARYGACEQLHYLLLNPEIVNQIWKDRSSTRRVGDTDLYFPWFQALFEVNVTHWPIPETYGKPKLKHIHWMPEFGPIQEDRSDIEAG